MTEKKILIVDDERYICDLVIDFLALENMTGIGACDFESALHLAAKENYDLIISDVNITNQKVESFIADLRRKKISAAVALMTGDHRINDRFAAEAGAIGVIHKPFQATPFLTSVKIFLETK